MRAGAWVRGLLIALLVGGMAATAGASGQETFYLGTDGYPRASLVDNPLGGDMPNFDRGRDVEPGLFLERSSQGVDETDETRYQQWQVDVGGRHLVGYPLAVIWGAPARFDPGSGVTYSVYLLDCDRTGSGCESLGSAEGEILRGTGETWVESWISFPTLDHRFDPGRYLALKVVVDEESPSDLMLAYGYARQRSRLTIHAEPPLLPESESVALVAVPSNSALKEKMIGVTESVQPVITPPAEDPATESAWAWAVTLTASTVLLVMFGAFLLSRLSRHGRHEQRALPVPIEERSGDRLSLTIR